MEWVRGEEIGCGSFANVSLVIPRKNSERILPMMVAKSSEAAFSATLQNEKQVFDELGVFPQIIRCFGDEFSVEKGQSFYNLFLEYASGGSLADLRRKRKFPESEIRRYTRSILKGLSYIHATGFVHCDIKLQNILLFNNGEVKIADFGLAKKTGDRKQSRFELRGTPLYVSPESVNDNECESPADIWALACAVVEMMTGQPAWKVGQKTNVPALLIRIGVGEELPEFPEELSEEGKDFLGKCFVKDPIKRWTAEMLLNHPFVAGEDNDGDENTVPLKESEEFSTSPRCPFDFPEWVSTQSSVGFSIPCLDSPENRFPIEREGSSCFDMWSSGSLSSAADRIRPMLSEKVPNWSVSDSWMTVR